MSKKPKERVTIVYGKNPIVLVCPHGYDDNQTDILTATAAKELDCNALINHGWKRAKLVDELNSIANCNNFNHVMDTANMAVNDEYGRPLIRLVNRALKKSSLTRANKFGYEEQNIYLIHVHGVGDWIKKTVKDKDLTAIIGYGQSDKPSHTCRKWEAETLGHYLTLNGLKTYMGANGGNYCARAKINMNQLFKLYPQYRIETVRSMQVELTYDSRSDNTKAEKTGKLLAKAVKSLLDHNLLDPKIGTVFPTV